MAAIVGIALPLVDPRATFAWVTRVRGSVGIDDPPRTIAHDPAGDVLAASARGVEKYDGASGATVWSIPADAGPQSGDVPIAVDGNGDLVVLQPCCGDGSVASRIVKRSGVDGRILWHVVPPADFSGTPTFAPDGDVIVVGAVGADLAVLKLDGANGKQAWLSTLPAEASHVATASVVDPRGDVAVGGTLSFDGGRAVVTKLSGRDGRLVWRTVVEGAARAIESIAVGPAGDVFVAGSEVVSSPISLHFLVARLRSATGQVLWRDASVPGRGPATPHRGAALATDPAGGVVVGGFVVDATGLRQPTVARWREDGTVAWQRVLAVQGEVTTVAVVGSDVVLGGLTNRTLTGSDLAIFDVALADGSPRWHFVVEDDGDGIGSSVALAAVPDGDSGVFVSGQIAYAASRRDALIARFRVADGATSWQQIVNEARADVSETAVAVAPDPQGNLVVGGELGSPATGLRAGVVKLNAGDGTEMWRTVIPGLFGPGRTAVDRDGNVFASGTVVIGTSEPPGSGGPFDPGTPAPVALTVVKMSGVDGSELWRTVVDAGSGRAEAGETAVASDGSVFATAWLWYPHGPSVVKLDGTTGVVQWISPIAPMTHQFFPHPLDSWLLVLGGDEDLFLAGPTISSTGHQNLAVSRLDARSGARLWGVELVDAWRLNGLAIDGRGDVVLVANTVEYPARRIAAKLVGANGALLWRTEMSRGAHLGIALTDDGDVLAAGATIVGDPAFETAVVLSVARLDGATGTGRWEYRSDFSVEGEALRVVVDHAGDAYVAGSLATEGSEQGFAVLKLDGARGELRWARVVPGAGPGADGQAADIALDGRGRVVAAGSLTGDGTALDFAVASLDAATGGDGTTTCRFRRSCSGPVPRVVIPRAPAGTLPRR